ncbi:hypothetical protein HGP28_13490 [Vibrio sp. SM6]|uniref:Uncharacterized protein n=1 Tax=Vibrio agarilyticus TaxID=2726741 RepID=A0A7X8TS09_9VIBR|nr:hypothetical protein [Vibrio agarilyticus]NLS13902.1 hypothetical protein [Vibrio agarilyticus]
MKVIEDSFNGPFHLSILGLGYEKRALERFTQERSNLGDVLVLGYNKHNETPQYKENKLNYSDSKASIFEGDDVEIRLYTREWLDSKIKSKAQQLNVLIDITVLSRSRLSALLYELIIALPAGSTLTISYEISQFVSAPEGLSPIKTVGDVIPELSGAIGDLTKPTSLVLGLGYENGKAIGLANYIDSEHIFVFLPIGIDSRFDESVLQNNKAILNEVPSSRIIKYRLDQPYNTYLDMRDLVNAVSKSTSPLLAPLGPKILTALSVLVSLEFGAQIPVWRVSSELEEQPVDRKASGYSISITVHI